MLYLFGRLALSDSYYFNDDFHADELPENQARHQQPALAAALPATGAAAGREPHALAATKKPAAESSNGLF